MGFWLTPRLFSVRSMRFTESFPVKLRTFIATYLKTLVSSNSSKLGISLIAGIAIAFWSARVGTVSFMQALNITYEEEEKRGTIRFQAVAIS
jgi:membrane protein